MTRTEGWTARLTGRGLVVRKVRCVDGVWFQRIGRRWSALDGFDPAVELHGSAPSARRWGQKAREDSVFLNWKGARS
jgi:hypothetical protein